MEIKLVTKYNSAFKGRGAFLCRSALRRKINLPKGTKTIWAAFTKELPDSGPIYDNSFTISPPTHGWDTRSRISEYRSNLTTHTEIILAKMYKRGYRYVRIEY